MTMQGLQVRLEADDRIHPSLGQKEEVGLRKQNLSGRGDVVSQAGPSKPAGCGQPEEKLLQAQREAFHENCEHPRLE